jgi:hypothetical protein
MKKWNLRVKGSAQELIEKLDAALGSVDRFVFSRDHDNTDSVLFNVCKPIKYPDQILHRNRIVVNGKIFQTDAKNEADVEITLTQHLIMTLTIFSVFISGLFAILFVIYSGSAMYIPGVILLAVGIVLWMALRKKFEKDIQKYKTLISGILES